MWQIIVGALLVFTGIYGLKDDFLLALALILIGAGFVVWWLHKKKIINIRKLLTGKSAPLQVLDLSAVGISYYEENIQVLARNNPKWGLTAKEIIDTGDAGRRIYRYNYVHTPVALVPEPENPHDKNALAVKIGGMTVGYISRDENVHVLTILKHKDIKSISCFVGGGDYKVISPDGHTSKFDSSISVTVRIKYV